MGWRWEDEVFIAPPLFILSVLAILDVDGDSVRDVLDSVTAAAKGRINVSLLVA